MTSQRFGGDWTEAKLDIIEEYLQRYTTALSKQHQWKKMYVDAFAGTGYRQERGKSSAANDVTLSLIPELAESDTQRFLEGSAHRALRVEPAFDHYLFIEQKEKYIRELEGISSAFLHTQTKSKLSERKPMLIFKRGQIAQIGSSGGPSSSLTLTECKLNGRL
jgi:three-Cys-motif partner protein